MTPLETSPDRALGPIRWLWWGVALLVLLAGYIDLARGGETIAPILLILGYVVFVPVAILKG